MNENLIKIAQAGGWINFFEPIKGGEEGVGRWLWHKGNENLKQPQLLERFNSLDSMSEAVLMQDVVFQKHFAENLFNVMVRKNPCYFHQLTVLDWQHAFVETLQQLKR